MSLLSTGASLFIPMLTKGLVDNFSLSSISTGQIVGLVAFFVMQTIRCRIVYLFTKLYWAEDCSWTERTFVEKGACFTSILL